MTRLPSLVLSLAFLLPGAAAAQAAGTLVLLVGADTVATEQVRLEPGRLVGELRDRTQGVAWRYDATLAPDGSVSRFDNSYGWVADTVGTPPRQRAEFTFHGDSVTVLINPGEQARVQRLTTRAGAVPFINPSFALLGQAVRRARVLGGDSVTVPLFAVSGGATVDAVVHLMGPDAARVTVASSDILLRLDANGMIASGEVPSQGLRIVRADQPPMPPPPRRDYSAPAGAPYLAREVSIRGPNGVVLAGTLTLPAGAAGRVPVVVTVTGSGPQDRDEALALLPGYALFREVADTLGRRGIAVLRYDDRGVGGSTGSYSGSTLSDFTADLRAVVTWLRTQSQVDAGKIVLAGHSEGALVAATVAADDPLIAGVVLLAGPGRTGREILEYQNAWLLEHSPELTAAARDSMMEVSRQAVDSMGRGGGWAGEFINHDPLASARRLRMPVLILAGETDRQVPADDAGRVAEAVRAGGNTRVESQVFAATNHLFLADPSGDPRAYTRVADRSVRPAVLSRLAGWVEGVVR